MDHFYSDEINVGLRSKIYEYINYLYTHALKGRFSLTFNSSLFCWLTYSRAIVLVQRSFMCVVLRCNIITRQFWKKILALIYILPCKPKWRLYYAFLEKCDTWTYQPCFVNAASRPHIPTAFALDSLPWRPLPTILGPTSQPPRTNPSPSKT